LLGALVVMRAAINCCVTVIFFTREKRLLAQKLSEEIGLQIVWPVVINKTSMNYF